MGIKNRSQLRELLLNAPQTEENRKKVPSELGGLWLCRPDDRRTEYGKKWMYIRVSLLAALGAYLHFGSPSYEEIRMLFIVVIAYEFSYNILWKDHMQLKRWFDNDNFKRKVDEAIDAYLATKGD